MTKKRNYPLLQHIRPYAQRMAFFICMCLWVVMAGCTGHSDIKNITPEECDALLKQQDVQLVDVRTEQEYGNGHLKEAILINIQGQGFTAKATQQLDKQKPVIIYCRSGRRSMQAAQILVNEGFETVYNMKGGILAWQAEGLPTE